MPYESKAINRQELRWYPRLASGTVVAVDARQSSLERQRGERHERERMGQASTGFPQADRGGHQGGNAASGRGGSRPRQAAESEGNSARVRHLGQADSRGGCGDGGDRSQEGGNHGRPG